MFKGKLLLLRIKFKLLQLSNYLLSDIIKYPAIEAMHISVLLYKELNKYFYSSMVLWSSSILFLWNVLAGKMLLKFYF